jgi:putative CocE/NonD family hydrolase
MRRAAILSLVLAAIAVASCRRQPPAATGIPVTERNVAVPMRDGVILRANVFRPAGMGPFPVLIYRTPYKKEDEQKSYGTFEKAVARGYAVVIQDVRGRYASDGEFNPYRNEGRDGFDTIEWAARQPWSTGAVGTFGASYPGAVQWFAAIERPPHLKAMVPDMTFSTPRNFFYSGGVFDLSWISWIFNDIAPGARLRQNLPGPRTDADAAAAWPRERSRLESHLPLSTLPDFEQVAPWYYEWLRHPSVDPWWDWAEIRGKYSRVDAAVLNFSGWHDEAYGPDGATTNFEGLLAARRGRSDLAAHLLMGPWPHGVDDTMSSKSGDRDFGPAAAIDYDELVLRWMDHYVKGVANGVDTERPVRYFLMGADAWRELDAWPPPAQSVDLFLAGATPGDATGVLRAGAPGPAGAASSFFSDPAHPFSDPFGDDPGAHDYRALLGRPGALFFDSAPLAQDLEITGRITAEIHLSCDAPDLDLWVRLLDVAPDGTAYNLMSPGLDVLRASYRSGTRRELLQPHRIYILRLENLITSNLFLRGHRLRVQISAAFFPHFSRNLQTGKLEMDSAESRAATITIHHDRAHPSRLILPVVGSAAGIESIR